MIVLPPTRYVTAMSTYDPTSLAAWNNYSKLHRTVHAIADRQPARGEAARAFDLCRADARRALVEVEAVEARPPAHLSLSTGGEVPARAFSVLRTTLRTIAGRRPNKAKAARAFDLCRADARDALALTSTPYSPKSAEIKRAA